MILNQTYTAVGPNGFSSFSATGGVAPYIYSVKPFGAGGSINSSTGAYTGPISASSNPLNAYDVVIATDSLGDTATAKVLVGDPLILFCDIVRTQMGLGQDQVWLWDQKLYLPPDSRLYIAISMPVCRPFGTINSPEPKSDGFNQSQSVNMHATVDIDVLSRGPAARDRKEEVIMALNSVYSEQQQEAFSFYIGRTTGRDFLNISNIDGAAIPYRYKISVQMQYMATLAIPAPYFDTFDAVQVSTDA